MGSRRSLIATDPRLIFLAVLCLLASSVDESDSTRDSMPDLTSDTFDNAIYASPVVVVFLYAPWCYFSTQLGDELLHVAEALKGQAKVFRIDVTVHVDIADRYGLRASPTLLLFQGDHDDKPTEYLGARDNASICNWVIESSRSNIHEVQSEEKLADILEVLPGLPYFVARGRSAAFKANFKSLADGRRNLGTFLSMKGDKRADPVIEVHRGFRERIELLVSEAMGPESLELLLQEQLLPLFWAINDYNYEVYAQRATEGMLWTLFQPETYAENATSLKEVFEEAARTFRQFPFVFVDTAVYEDHVREQLGCTKFPSVVLQIGNFSDQTQDLINYKLPLEDNAEAVSAKLLVAWIQAVLAGEVTADSSD
eukprot:CAMPEP_0117502224 /NCGR_PEP_ID=MMETSP0784-20121206/23703_1 /TAXON_ID=39447 /ORGANISM="" /LENGTH=368 /DNA_ID=CAMNT_0005297501 /DNA_START=43 /DNA_END=1149 /DNA_ORIENTATION=+